MELETLTGHKYMPMTNFDVKENMQISETATNGKEVGACYARCYNAGDYHGKDHYHAPEG